MPRLLFLTTANLTTNPRLLKEVKLAREAGYAVEVVAFRLGNWSDDLDEATRQSLPEVSVTYLSATRRPLLPWALSTLAERVSQRVLSPQSQQWGGLALASNKRSGLLWHHLRYRPARTRPDLIVAHNLGALYPAYALAQREGVPFGFDVEDYHPGETIAGQAAAERQRREALLAALLPQAAYVSYAAPLIGTHTLALLKTKDRPPHVLIHNCFSAREFRTPTPPTDERLHLVWFSQYVDYGRGLELLLPALQGLADRVRLTLIGHLRPGFAAEWVAPNRAFVRTLPPMSQSALHAELARHDVGLALDTAAADFNREIALTNKIIANFQAGLYLMATDTAAQSAFLEEQPEAGVLVAQNTDALRQSIEVLIQVKDSLRATAGARYEAARHLSWDRESQKLLAIWRQHV